MQSALDRAYMKCAYAIAELSQAKRKQVGAIIVAADGGIIAEGVNGTPPGFSNDPEYHQMVCRHEWRPGVSAWYCTKIDCTATAEDGEDRERYSTKLVTKPEVIHAEANAFDKLARSTVSGAGGTLYVTATPCFNCALRIISVKIVRVVCAEYYTGVHGGPSGEELLRKANIEIHYETELDRKTGGLAEK